MDPETTVKELFISACKRNDLNTVRTLLFIGADVNWRDVNDGWSGLHYSARENYWELLELLLIQTGVNVNIKTNKMRHL